MELFWLFVAHCFGDFVFQTTWMAAYKRISFYVRLVHSVVWTACILAALYCLSLEPQLWMVPYLVIGHNVIDFITGHYTHTISGRFQKRWLYVDQVLHFLQIWGLIMLYQSETFYWLFHK